ncbi:MAG TPA: adenosine kinase [Pseudomonadales bacterium]
MRQYQVYGIGAALVDTEIRVDDSFLQQCGIEKGYMTLVDEARQHELMALLQDHLVASRRASGGSAANSIIAHSYLGGSAYYSCKVANDDNGAFYLNDLREAGVEACYQHSLAEQGITGKCLVMITPDAERTMNTFLGISETLCEKNVNLDALASSEWLYMEGYLVTSPTGRQAAIRAREHAQRCGVKTALSFSDPGMVEFFRDGLQQMIGERVDLVFCNEHEALGWAGSDNLDDAMAAIRQVADTFAITLGARGALVFDGHKLHEIAATPVRAVDTNGAGDAFAGGFMYGITHGMSYAEAGRLAVMTAGRVVSEYGPRMDREGYRQVLATFAG